MVYVLRVKPLSRFGGSAIANWHVCRLQPCGLHTIFYSNLLNLLMYNIMGYGALVHY